MILWSFVAFILLLWLAKAQRDHIRDRDKRRERQGRQRVGAERIPGSDGQRPTPEDDLDAEEQRLLAKLRSQQKPEEG